MVSPKVAHCTFWAASIQVFSSHHPPPSSRGTMPTLVVKVPGNSKRYTLTFGPGGAKSYSQGRKALVHVAKSSGSPGGATSKTAASTVDAAPPGASRLNLSPISRGLRPWLHDSAPPGHDYFINLRISPILEPPRAGHGHVIGETCATRHSRAGGNDESPCRAHASSPIRVPSVPIRGFL